MPFRDITMPLQFDAPSGPERYLAQLRNGFRSLMFEPGLEAEYRQLVLAESFRPAILINIAALIVWVGFAIFDFVRLDVPSRWPIAPDIWLLLSARWAVLGLLVIYLCPACYRRIPLDWRAFSGYIAIGAAASLTAILYRANGLAAIEMMQIVIVMSAFLPMGLRFYSALLACLCIVALSVLFGLLILPPQLASAHLALVSVMMLAIPLAAVGGYLREHAHRRQFLLAALLSHQAQFDSLTNLANRRLFERHANATIAHAARTDEALTLAVIDIDHFKQFNDLNGHAAGDVALRAVADLIADSARRPMDMAARLGGEEFGLLLFGIDLARAQPVLEALRERVAAMEVAGQRLTISIGAATANNEGLESLYRRADRLLYRSKEEGRNRVSIDLQPIPGAL